MNDSILYIIVFPLIISFVITTVITPFCIFFIKKVGLFDDPYKRKHPGIIHTKPIPRGGGIPLFLGIVVASIFLLSHTQLTIAIFSASFIALIVGVLDDKKDISPYVRFLINIFVAFLVVKNGITAPFITNPFGGILYLNTTLIPIGNFSLTLSEVVALVWIVWVMNMLNWSKGVDGQMPGIVAISAFVIGMLSLRFGFFDPLTITNTKLSFIISGSALGFLLYNFYPAKIFPGYGATSVYLLLSVVSLLSSAKLATAILVMGVPLIDGVFTIIRRIITGHSPFWHDKKHLHHLLLERGFDQRQIALFYWSISAILGALSLTLSSTGKFFAIVMLGVLLGGALIFLHGVLKKKHEQIFV